MQQQKNPNLQYSPKVLPERDGQLIQLKDTPAYRRNQQRTEIASRHTKLQAVLTSVIGEHQIGSIRRHEADTSDLGLDCLLEIDRVSTGSIDLVKLRWQGTFQLERYPTADRCLIYLTLRGSLSHQMHTSPASVCPKHQTSFSAPELETAIDPSQTAANVPSPLGEVLLISIDRDAIDAVLSKLLDRTCKQPLTFLTNIDPTSELGISLNQFGQFLWASAAQEDRPCSSLVLQKLEQAFLACLIEGLPNNYSEEILYQTDGALACHVRKARTFIEAHLHEDIKLDDIATATGVCARLLQKAFSQHCGCSPMRFVTQARLQQIQQELIQANNNTKIVDVMMHYQFMQGGKFAKEYQQLFGEKPSETLKRSSQADRVNSPLWHQLDDVMADRVAGGLFARLQHSFLPARRSQFS